jgi:hypothetical protein
VVRGRGWLVVLPLLAVGSEAAHALVGVFAPADYRGAELFGASGGGPALVPLLLVLAAAVVGFGLVTASNRARHLRAFRVAIAALPLVVFAVQEHIEYAVGNDQMGWTLVTRPAFWLGLALQLPFALLAYLAARLLLAIADVVVARFRAPGRPRIDLRPVLAAAARTCRPRRGRPSGDARFNRGPPLSTPV